MFKSGRPQKSQICWRCPSAGTSMSAPQSGPSPRPRRPCSAPRGTASGCQSAPRPTSCSGEGRGLERVHRESVMRTVQCNMPALTAHSDSIPKQAGWPRSLPLPAPRPRGIPCSLLCMHHLKQAFSVSKCSGFAQPATQVLLHASAPPTSSQQPELFIAISYGTGFPIQLF